MLKDEFHSNNGQILIELIIALTIGAIIIASVVGAIGLVLRSNAANKELQVASALNRELIDNVRIIAEAQWHDIYNLTTKGPNSQYKLQASTTPGILVVATGTQTLDIENATFTRFFAVENVTRDTNGNLGAGTDDPSTQKITSHSQWVSVGTTNDVTVGAYIARWRNSVFVQTNWSGGAGQEGPVNEPDDKFSTSINVNFSSPGLLKVQGF